MYHINFNNPIHVHFIGIGGISMSGLAHILRDKNFTVSGSDAAESALTKELTAAGCHIVYSQTADNITSDIDLVVYTAAIRDTNPELSAARAAGIPTITRAELLGQIMTNYKTAVNIAGTHGKTTTTSMLTEILMAGNCDPTISVGGILDSIGGNIRVGQSGIFVTEACEYTNSFLSFFPTMEIILNIEADHLDFFKDLDDIRNSFHLFAERMPEGGTLIINSDIEHYQEITRGINGKIITFGKSEDSMYRAENITYDEFARPSYDLIKEGTMLGRIQLGVTGEHNVYNSLSAIAAAAELGISIEDIQEGLSGFSGPHRRFEKKGEIGGITIIDDYAHHPQEIHATLSAAKNYPHKTLWCVFQPHTYTRTKALMDDFAKSLAEADEVVLADIYPARETDNLGISSADLAEKIEKLGTKVHYLPSFDDIETFLLENCVNGDLLITMGAGDIVKVGEKLLGQ